MFKWLDRLGYIFAVNALEEFEGDDALLRSDLQSNVDYYATRL